MIDINRILEEYVPDDSIFNEEDEKLTRIKHIIYEKLTEPERRIILIYAELGSLRKAGKELGVVASTLLYKINEIRAKIFENLYDTN